MKKSILLGSVAILLYGTTAFGQGGSPGNNSSVGLFLGFDGTGLSQPLDIRNNFINQPIRFFTNNSPFPQMRLEANGHVGIGLTTGNDVLDILPNVANTGYGINGITVLHNSGSQNIFAGENAGMNNSSGFSNSFFGMDAGVQNVRMGANTYNATCRV